MDCEQADVEAVARAQLGAAWRRDLACHELAPDSETSCVAERPRELGGAML
jgi:hypothetical protein